MITVSYFLPKKWQVIVACISTIGAGATVQANPSGGLSVAQSNLLNAIQARQHDLPAADKTKKTVDGYKPAALSKAGRVMVKLKPGTDPVSFFTTISQLASQAVGGSGTELTLVHSFSLHGRQLKTTGVTSPSQVLVLQSKTLTSTRLLDILKGQANVQIAEPDRVVSIAAIPNDPMFPKLWGLDNQGQTGGTAGADIKAVKAWDTTTGSHDIVVGVIDTGVDYHHPDLVANMWTNPGEIPNDGIDNDGNGYVDDVHGIDTINGDTDPMDDHFHGTHVSGTIGAVGNNSEGVVGINWNVAIAACKFLDSNGYGWTSGEVECIDYFTGLRLAGVNVVATNNSYGCSGAPDCYSQIEYDTIHAQGDAGIVFVAAAGNDSSNDDDPNVSDTPASYDLSNILSVAATDNMDNLAWFSNYGATSVDLGAPGVDILSTTPSKMGFKINTPIFSDNFESGLSGWEMLGVDLATPVKNDPKLWWALTNEDAASPTWSLGDSQPGQNYRDNTISSAVHWVDLSGTPAGKLLGFAFKIRGQNEGGYDWLNVYATNDGGTTWTWVWGTSDTYADWTTVSGQIPHVYATANFGIAFVKTNDPALNYPGYLIDDVAVGTGAIDTRVAHYDTYSGTSMATPHVTGAVALYAALHPSASVKDRITAILSSVDPIPALSGITVTGGRLNLDLVTKYVSPPPPVPPITIIPTAGGNVTPIPPTGTELTRSFTVMPNSGYITGHTVSGTCPLGSWNGNVWTTGAITDTCTVSFSFFCELCMPKLGGWRSAPQVTSPASLRLHQ